MCKFYGPRNLNRLAAICDDPVVSEILRIQAAGCEADINHKKIDTPPLHFSIRKLSDFTNSTSIILLEKLSDGIDSTIFNGKIVQLTQCGERIVLYGIDSLGDKRKTTSNLCSAKLMTRDDYRTLRKNRNMLPFYFTNSKRKASNIVYDEADCSPEYLVDMPSKIPEKIVVDKLPKKKPVYKKGYYFIGGLTWAPKPMFIPGKILSESLSRKSILVKLDRGFPGRQDGIINIKLESRRWINESLLYNMKTDNDFVDAWLEYQDTITETKILWDISLRLELFSPEDFKNALSVIPLIST